jgi:Tol biopolymer transport system component
VTDKTEVIGTICGDSELREQLRVALELIERLNRKLAAARRPWEASSLPALAGPYGWRESLGTVGAEGGTRMGFISRRQVVLLAVVGLLASGCTWITRASVDPSGGDSAGGFPDNHSAGASLSDDGRYVAFDSNATNLVPGDGNDTVDVFVRDLRTNATTRVSVDSDGGDSNSGSSSPSFSDNGRYIAFRSGATDLVPGGNAPGVFVRDLQANTTTWVSVGDVGGGEGSSQSISGDGRYVAFESAASGLVPGDGNGLLDVFVRDLQANTTTRVSVDTAGGDPDSRSFQPSISDDGRHVAFISTATDLVPDDFAIWDVFVRDLQANTTTAVSVDPDGNVVGSGCCTTPPSISADGRYVVFGASSRLVPGGEELGDDVYVRDLLTSATSRVSVDTAGGGQNNGTSSGWSINDDGRYVAFVSWARDLVPGDGNNKADVFVRDLQANATTRVSVDFLGKEANNQSGRSSFSGDGRYVAFESFATNLVPGDGNGLQDVFVRAVLTPTVASVTPNSLARGTTATLAVTGSGFLPGTLASAGAFTENGGVTVNSVTVLSETELEVSVSVGAAAPTGTRHLAVWNPGTGPGALATGFGGCQSCLTIT